MNHIYMFGESAPKREEQWINHLDYIAQNKIGLPLASEKYTVSDLQQMGMIGIYAH